MFYSIPALLSCTEVARAVAVYSEHSAEAKCSVVSLHVHCEIHQRSVVELTGADDAAVMRKVGSFLYHTQTYITSHLTSTIN